MMKYPIGIQNFEKLRSEGYVYVDKTPRQLLIFTVLIALLFPIGSWAKLNPGDDAATAKAKVMVVTTMDGKSTKLGLKNTPIITIEAPYLVYKSDVAEARFELDQLRDIKYEDVVPISGDASGDGVINRADVDETVQYIFGKPSGDFIFSNADTNNDQKVNAADIVQISDLLKNPNINDISKSRNAANLDDQASYGQQHQYALYNYRNDGNFNAWLNLDIDSVTYSRIDTLGVERNAVVVQEVWTPDSLYRIPLEAIDSIGFRAPAPEFASDILYIRDYHAIHTTLIDGLTIHFDNTIHNDSIPSVGQVILSATESTPYEDGFAGKVIDIKYGSNGVSVICEEVSIGDIYKRLVVVGKVSNDTDLYPSLARAKTRSSDPWVNIDEDGVIPIQLDKKEFSIGDLVKITSPRPKLTCSFYIYISELYYEGNVKLDLYHPDLTYTLSFSLDQLKKYSEFGKLFAATFSTDEELQKWLEEYKNKKIKDYQKEEDEYEEELSKQWFERSKIKIPIPSPYPGIVNFQLEISPIVKAKGKLELDSEFKTDAWQSMNMKWKGLTPLKILSLGKGLPDIPAVSVSARQDPFKSAKLDLKAKGTLTLGFKTLLNVNLVHKDLIYLGLACDAAMEAGGTLDVTILDTERPEMNMYERLKDTNLKISTYAKGYAEAGTTPYKFLSASTHKLTLFSDEYLYNIFPHFTKPALPKYNNGKWQGKEPLSFFSYPSKDIYIPCKIGMRIVDEEGNPIKEYQDSYRYLDEIEWRNKYVEMDVSDLPSGNYKCYPTISFFGWKPFNAGPVQNFTVPLPLVASPSQLNLKVGSTGIVDYFGGWDSFAVVITGDEDIVSFVSDEEKTPRKIKVYAEKVGTTTLQIEDRRTGEKLSVPIIVTDETVTQSTIKVEPAKIDFGTMARGASKTEHFTITNTGDGPMNLLISCAGLNSVFDISELGEFYFNGGESKVFTVVCTCPEDASDDGKYWIRIDIDSDASNAEEYNELYIYMEPEKCKSEGYAVYEDGTLIFYCDDKRIEKNGEIFDIGEQDYPGWRSKMLEINEVIFDSSYANARPKSTSNWFEGMHSVTNIKGLRYLDTSEVTNMDMMFYDCYSLTDIDLSNFHTDNVEQMNMMFMLCSSLNEIDISNFNTSKVKNMHGMFSWCDGLKTIYSNNTWTMINVTDSGDMFKNCHKLVGGKGTMYNSSYTDGEYARIDDGPELPGYFTNVNAIHPKAPVEAVDLGLPSGTLWANMNVGATAPEEYGDYFAWGEITPQSNSEYTYESYKYCNGWDDYSKYRTNKLTKYCTDPDFGNNGFTDGNKILEARDDAATYNWGDGWCIPTISQYKELLSYTTSEIATQNGVNGVRFTSMINNNSVFFPVAGYRYDDGLHYAGSRSSYWASEVQENYPSRAYTLSVDWNWTCVAGWGQSERCFGLPVRAVINTPPAQATIKVEPQDIDFGTMTNGSSKTDYFIVYNTGRDNLVFHLEYSTLDGVFNVLEGGEETVLKPGESKKYTVTCTIPKDFKYSGGGVAIYVRSNASNDESIMVGLGVNVIHEEKEEIYVTPTEIDFGRVELDTDKTANFTVTNNKSTDVTFSVPYWGDYFEVSDTNEDITLAPGESKVFTITAHGMKRGSQASCEFRINVNTEEDMEKPIVKATLTGWDTKPLTLATNSISLSRGEEKKVEIVYGSLNYELISDDPHLFIANIADHGRSGGGWYDNYSSTTCFVRIEAGTTAEKATIRVKDKDTGEEVALQVTIDAVD